MNRAFLEHFRCPEELVDFRPTGPLSPSPGYFKLNGITCYGRTTPETGPAWSMFRSSRREIRRNGRTCCLPFDPDEVVENIRCERYVVRPARHASGDAKPSLGRELYYMARPLLPVAVRKHLQKIALHGWKKIEFPQWPIDLTIERLFNEILRAALLALDGEPIPFIWFWPDGHRACLIMTHDVETEAGRDFCGNLMDLDESYGIQSSFQVVPEKRYEVTETFLNSLIVRGHEVNVHGLSHDGHLFDSHEEFLRRVEKINDYGREYGAAGFRSPVMYRNADWMRALDFAYDMSFPNTAHLDPQRGGCATCMPYFIGDLLELPLTMLQDYTVFNILRRASIDLWQYQSDIVLRNHGLISFIVHPDYVADRKCFALYQSLLEFLNGFCAQQRVVNMLPREVNLWWRQRNAMRLVREGGRWVIQGEGRERARIATAMLRKRRVVFELQQESG